MGNLAVTYSDLGRHKDALKMNEEVLEFRRRVLPADHPDIATSMDNLATTYAYLGRYEDALKVHKEVLVMQWRSLPRDHPDIASSMFSVGIMMFDLGDVAKAMHNMQGAVDMLERAGFAADHPQLVIYRDGHAHCIRTDSWPAWDREQCGQPLVGLM